MVPQEKKVEKPFRTQKIKQSGYSNLAAMGSYRKRMTLLSGLLTASFDVMMIRRGIMNCIPP
jgi:hypothetical protein